MKNQVVCVALGAVFSACATAAAAQTAAHVCTRGGDERIIEVFAPGDIGAACDLKYTREGGANVSVPYHADHDAAYCTERARALTASLADAGYACEAALQAAPPMREATRDISDILVTDEPAAALAGAAAAPGEDPALVQPALEARAEPVTASRGPVALSPETVSSTGAPARRTSGYGKLIGADPQDPRALSLAQEDRLAPAPAQGETPPPEQAAASSASAPLADNAPASSSPPRSAPEIIEALLNAQAAAWNDGDLDAFMDGYWKDPELTFVSGATMTKGWNAAMKRYRDSYGSGAALGHLSFNGLDVRMLDEEAALVIGRYRLARGETIDAGAFTLVMKRFDGLWRIVHDHTVGDPAGATMAASQ